MPVPETDPARPADLAGSDRDAPGRTDQLPVTVVIPVRNEERNLPSCLARLGAFAQVLVVDSNSTDATREIAASAGSMVIDFDWNGRFPKKRNWVLAHHSFATPWVLFLDADELVTDAFVEALRKELPATPHNGFWINYHNHFLGRHLKHGVPQRKLALFRIGAGSYERIDEVRWSELDMEVHEHPVLTGSVGVISEALDHRDFRGLEHFIARHNSYSSWEARRYLQLMRDAAAGSKFTARQRFKYKSVAKWWFSPIYFLATYLTYGGFRDGRAGLVYALFKAAYFFQVREKILEAKRDDDASRLGTPSGAESRHAG